MELDYAFLAENATRGADGKLFVFGGDLAKLETENLPGSAFLTLVARFSAGPADVDKEHTCKVELSHPDGSRHGMLGDTKINTMPNPEDSTADTGAGLVVKLGLVFPQAGKYLVHLSINGLAVKSLPLWLNYQPKPGKDK